MEEFKHDTMARADSQIRLLKVVPGAETPLQCTIETFDVDNCPTYEALSYTWGPPKPCIEISLNGKAFEIRANLYHFLKRIAHGSIICEGEPLSPRYLWTDAICIDQENKAEKSCQVGRMGRVYQQALCAVVWLGEGTEGTEIAMRLILDTKATYRTHRDLLESVSKGHPYLERYVRELPNLKGLFKLQYWSRMWVIQEFLLAKNVTIVSGNQSIDFDDMSMMYWAHFNLRSRSLIESTELPHCVMLFENSRRNVREKLEKGRSFPELKRVVEQFWSLDGFGCSNPRDRIYALLSLAEDGDKVAIDYSKPPSWVYWETMAQWDMFLPTYVKWVIELGVAMDVNGKEENAIFHDKKPYGWSYGVLGYSPIDIFEKPDVWIERIVRERAAQPGQVWEREESAVSSRFW